jgi:HSF-type DNA-binding
LDETDKQDLKNQARPQEPSPATRTMTMPIFLKNLDLSKLKSKTIRKKTKTKVNRPQPISFPIKLFRMLEEVEREGIQSIVGWNPDGKSFQVYDHERFVKEVLPSHFKQSKYKSFQRQLNFYSFQRIISGPLEGSYGHPSFVKGNSELCKSIKRNPSHNLEPSTDLDPTRQIVISNSTRADFSAADRHCFVDMVDSSTESAGIELEDFSSLMADIRRHSLFGDTTIAPLPIELATTDSVFDSRLSFVGKSFYVIPPEFAEV